MKIFLVDCKTQEKIIKCSTLKINVKRLTCKLLLPNPRTTFLSRPNPSSSYPLHPSPPTSSASLPWSDFWVVGVNLFGFVPICLFCCGVFFFPPNLNFWVVSADLCSCTCIWWVLITSKKLSFFDETNTK